MQSSCSKLHLQFCRYSKETWHTYSQLSFYKTYSLCVSIIAFQNYPLEIGQFWATSGTKCRVCGTNFIISFVNIPKKPSTHNHYKVHMCRSYDMYISMIAYYSYGIICLLAVRGRQVRAEQETSDVDTDCSWS